MSAVFAVQPLGFELPASALVLGAITGITYGLLSVGLVLVYRTNRIINFAHGQIGAFGATVFALFVNRWSVPYYAALPVALVIGGGVGAIAEVAVVRRLRNAPKLMSVVATLGLAQFLVVFALVINTQGGSGLVFPEPPGLPTFDVGALVVRPSYTGILVFGPVVAVALAVFLRWSRFGLALRAAAANPDAARMSGVFASRMSSLAWALAGALSTFTAILVVPTVGLASGASFGPSLLLRALVGAVLARMTNIPGALAGGVVLGVVEGILLRNYSSGGTVELVLFAIILVALLAQRRVAGREDDKGSAWSTVQPFRALPEAVAALPAVRNLTRVLGLSVLAVMLVLPLSVSNTTALTLSSILGFAMIALSVGVITGLGGQLSLGQFGFAAIGAVASYQVATRTGGNVPLAAVYGGLAAAIASIVIGLPALRIKGLFLTVTTLSFGSVVAAWLLQQPWALGRGVDPGRAVVAGHALSTGRSYYYFVLAAFVVLFLVARNVRRAGFGRLLVAVRDNEDAARSFTVRSRLVKVQGFLLAGFIAGAGGAVYGHTYSSIAASAFLTQYSIDVVVMAVVGGIGLLSGPLLGAIFVKGVPAFLPLDTAGLAATQFGLLIVILYFPGGLAQLVAPLRDRVILALARRAGVDGGDDDDEAVPGDGRSELSGFRIATPRDRAGALHPTHRRTGYHDPSQPLLVTLDLRKRFGGVAALDGVSLEVAKGETVGLIGPNGAGKTTLFEALGGFTRPDRGRVVFAGRDVTPLSPEARGELGLIRSFQDAELFPTMTVLETVQLALERQLPSGLVASVVGFRGRDRHRAAMARDLVGSMGLWPYRNKQVQELSTGTRRFTELACLVALEPTMLLLDEPSSGIAQRESEALGALLADLKAQLNLTLLVIEHDIPLIMGISDRVIAMESGRVIAAGTPEVVRHDPAVVEAYLGGKLEAIERSGLRTDAITVGVDA